MDANFFLTLWLLISLFSVVLIGCPGADAHETWTRAPLPPNVFKKSTTKRLDYTRIGKHLINSTSLHPALPKGATPSWARSGIRLEVPKARVLTYAHSAPVAGTMLKKLAYDLLNALSELRGALARPLFFICHSIGGLVLKLALTEASRNSKFRPLLDHCYGVTFFG